MVSRAFLIGLPAALLFASGAQAQDKGGPLYKALGSPEDWSISGSIRPRIEVIDGQFRPNASTSDQLVSLRTTLAVEYHPERLRIGAEVWDARGYFEKDNSSTRTGEINAFEPVQAYIGYSVGTARNTTFTAGRFTQNIGSRRFVARQAWRNTTNSFLGAKVETKDANGNSAILFWTMAQRIVPDDFASIEDNAVELDHFGTDLQFFGGAVTIAKIAGKGELTFQGYGLLENDTPRFATTNRRLLTPAVRFYRAPAKGKIDFEAEAAYQTGTSRRTTAASDRIDVPVSAYYGFAGIGYTFDAPWSPRVFLNGDLASGNNGGGRLTRFDTLFGFRRMLGPPGLYGLLQRANLVSPELRVAAKPTSSLDGYLSVRPSWLENRRDSFAASGVRDPSGQSGRYAGTQFEAQAHWSIVPSQLEFEAAGVYLAKGRFLTNAPNAPATGDTVYGYANLTYSF